MLKLFRINFLFLIGLLVGALAYADTIENIEGLESVIILGSAEHPDPVLDRVKYLEKQGILTNVIIMESFPVQIKVTGPKNVIKELQDMPRKVSPSFK